MIELRPNFCSRIAVADRVRYANDHRLDVIETDPLAYCGLARPQGRCNMGVHHYGVIGPRRILRTEQPTRNNAAAEKFKKVVIYANQADRRLLSSTATAEA